jgi:pimeloyl-ACP methyl ester carboxylesterase
MSKSHTIAFISGWGLSTSVFDALKLSLGDQYQYFDLAMPIQDGVACNELDEVLAYLEAQMPSVPCHIVAWSLGGMFAVRLAERSPKRVASLITLSTGDGGRNIRAFSP